MTTTNMPTVTGRIKDIKQPRGGYLPVRKLKETSFEDGLDLTDIKKENISPSVVGSVVDYLTRLFGVSRSSALHTLLSVLSASGQYGMDIMDKASFKLEQISKSDTLSDEVIINACYLVNLEIAKKREASLEMFQSFVSNIPDEETIKSIRTMVERSLTFVESYGPIKVQEYSYTFSSFTNLVQGAEFDFLTEEALWEMKVSVSKPKIQHTLQLLMYYIMGLKSEILIDDFKAIKQLGIFNPRLNKIYTFEIEDIDQDIIETVSTEVIGY